jgi:hypothetical protein
MIYQTTEMFFAFPFSILVFTDRIQFWHILVLLPIFGFLKSVYQVSRQAYLFDLVGMADLFSKTTNQTLVQLLSPNELRGRILGVFMLDRGMKPLGGFVMGAGASLLGAPLALALGAGVCMAFTLSLLLKAPQVRKL